MHILLHTEMEDLYMYMLNKNLGIGIKFDLDV